jgi:hypothetical protein
VTAWPGFCGDGLGAYESEIHFKGRAFARRVSFLCLSARQSLLHVRLIPHARRIRVVEFLWLAGRDQAEVAAPWASLATEQEGRPRLPKTHRCLGLPPRARGFTRSQAISTGPSGARAGSHSFHHSARPRTPLQSPSLYSGLNESRNGRPAPTTCSEDNDVDPSGLGFAGRGHGFLPKGPWA